MTGQLEATMQTRRPTFPAMLLGIATVILNTACGDTAETRPQTPAPKPDPAAGVEAIHRSALVIDAHADIEIKGQPSPYVGDDGLSQVTPTKMRAGGVDAVVMSIAVGPKPRNAQGYAEARTIADAELAAVQELVNNPAERTVLATSADALLAAHAAEQTALVLGLQNALILGNDIAAIDEFYKHGVRVIALTHMGHNDFADSSRPLYLAETGAHEATEEHGGLSALGQSALARINALGAIFDVSQLSKNATLQAVAASTAPVIASHSNVRALTDVSRNLSDEEIDAIAAGGGVIHVAPFRGYLFDSTNPDLDRQVRAARIAAGIKSDYLYPFELYWEIEDTGVKEQFLNTVSGLLGPGSIDDVLNHIDYIVERVGVDHVGIGTDFNHGSGIEGFKDASEALNITRALLGRGYSADDISKIWGGNFVRVWRAAERARTEDLITGG